MSTADTRHDERPRVDAYGRTRAEFDDPVIVRTGVSSRGRVHDLADDGAALPACHHGERDGAKWAYADRSTVEHIDACRDCSGETDGRETGPRERKECPFCGELHAPTTWPHHITECDARPA